MSRITRHIMPYHGGKQRLAPGMMSHFPAHRIDGEPFGGAASVLRRKPRRHVEVYNDLDEQIVNMIYVLRDEKQRKRLIHQLRLTPYTIVEFKQAHEHSEDPIERARRTLFRALMGFGSAGATQASSGFRSYVKKGSHLGRWPKLPGHIQAFSSRLPRILIENRPALPVMRDHDTPQTLFDVDPPYLPATRQLQGKCYRHDMTEAQPVAWLEVFRTLQGRIVLNGYPPPLYDDLLNTWQRVEKPALISAHRGGGWRTEVLWRSPHSLSTLCLLPSRQQGIALPKRA